MEPVSKDTRGVPQPQQEFSQTSQYKGHKVAAKSLPQDVNKKVKVKSPFLKKDTVEFNVINKSGEIFTVRVGVSDLADGMGMNKKELKKQLKTDPEFQNIVKQKLLYQLEGNKNDAFLQPVQMLRKDDFKDMSPIVLGSILSSLTKEQIQDLGAFQISKLSESDFKQILSSLTKEQIQDLGAFQITKLSESDFTQIKESLTDTQKKALEYAQKINRFNSYLGNTCPETKKMTANRLSALNISNEEIVHAVENTQIVVSERVNDLLKEYLKNKQENGTSEEKIVYKNMSVDDFKQRLMAKRPFVYYSAETKVTKRDGFDIGQRDKVFGTVGELKDYIDVEERRLSTFCGFSSPTFFINDGSRGNCGIPEDDPHVEKGTYVGLNGARFEKGLENEYRHMILTSIDKSNPIQNQAMWEKFYGVKFGTFENAQMEGSGERFKEIKIRDLGTCYFDTLIYEKHMANKIEPFMDLASKKDPADDSKAYLHIVALGAGVWAEHVDVRDVENTQIKIYLDYIRNHDCSQISDIDFSYFREALREEMRKALGDDMVVKDIKGNKVKIHCTRNSPAEITEEKKGKRLIAQFAWDGNAYPGNEYYDGHTNASGDPAAACCSTIVETYGAKFFPSEEFKKENV